MSKLLRMPALWPVLALNPEPSMDPEDPLRWYLELFGPEIQPPQIAEQKMKGLEAAPQPVPKPSIGYRPSSFLHQLPRRR